MNPLDHPTLKQHRARWFFGWGVAEGMAVSAAWVTPYALWRGVFATLAVFLFLAAVLCLFLHFRRKSKAQKGAKQIEEALVGGYKRLTPEEAREKTAQMDYSIAAGLEKAREHGFNVYELPWYLIVG